MSRNLHAFNPSRLSAKENITSFVCCEHVHIGEVSKIDAFTGTYQDQSIQSYGWQPVTLYNFGPRLNMVGDG